MTTDTYKVNIDLVDCRCNWLKANGHDLSEPDESLCFAKRVQNLEGLIPAYLRELDRVGQEINKLQWEIANKQVSAPKMVDMKDALQKLFDQLTELELEGFARTNAENNRFLCHYPDAKTLPTDVYTF